MASLVPRPFPLILFYAEVRGLTWISGIVINELLYEWLTVCDCKLYTLLPAEVPWESNSKNVV